MLQGRARHAEGLCGDGEVVHEAEINGEFRVLYDLGLLYYHGMGVEKPIEKAEKYLLEATKHHDAKACLLLAYIYDRGEVELPPGETDTRAVALLNMASMNGSPEGSFMMGNRYFDGKGVKQSYLLAFQRYSWAADNGHADALCKMGDMYMEGLSVERSERKARKCYRKAADGGSETAVSRLATYFGEKRGGTAHVYLEPGKDDPGKKRRRLFGR